MDTNYQLKPAVANTRNLDNDKILIEDENLKPKLKNKIP